MSEIVAEKPHLGGIDLVWEGIGQDSWEMIEDGANQLVTSGDVFQIGERLLEVIRKNDRTWMDAEELVTEFYHKSTPRQMTDEEVLERDASRVYDEESGDLSSVGTVWDEEAQEWVESS